MVFRKNVSFPLIVFIAFLVVGCQNQAAIDLKFPTKSGTKTYQMKIHTVAKTQYKIADNAKSPDTSFTISVIDTENQDKAFTRRTLGKNESGAVVYDNSESLSIANSNRDILLNGKSAMDFSNLLTSEKNWYQGKTISKEINKRERGLIISGSVIVQADGVSPNRLQLTIRGNQTAKPEKNGVNNPNSDFEFTTITTGEVVFNPDGIYLIEASLNSITHGIAIDPTVKMNQDPFFTDSTMDISVQETTPIQ